MDTTVKRGDRVLGYLGLLLIGALGWVADRLPAGPAAPQAVTHSRPMHVSGRAHA